MKATFREILDGLEADRRRDNEFLLESFLDWVTLQGMDLYPEQENAALELFDGKNIILNTPTGSGKSLVAFVLHYQALAQGRRSVYTCPVKALVNEKWMMMCREFGSENVGLSTGDATVNRDAPILCCTAEILANIALSEGSESLVGDVVMDEFHYYSDRERGVAWQVPLLTMRKTRFLLMSATLGDTDFFQRTLTELNGRETTTIRSRARPVPLDFEYAETALPETVQRLVAGQKAPVYVVHFTQAEAAKNAQSFTSLELCDKQEKAKIAEEMGSFRFSSPYGPDLKRWLRQGIGLHHAGLLPKYRILVEKIAQKGLLKVICGTDTLGVGINIPIRCVLFTQLCKFSGEKTEILTSRDFHQIAGRAGRKGYDNVGFVVAQAPEHVIENRKLAAKASNTAKKGSRKFVKKKPPERGYVHWDEETFNRLIESMPERLTSRFQVSHGMLLNVLARPGDGCGAMRDLIRQSHESRNQKKLHTRRAFQLFRSLRERGIIEMVRGEDAKAALRLKLDLQQDFSMNQVLALYLLDTIPLLDPESEEYPFDLLTLVESILENPDLILRRQLDRLKTEAVARMKSEGVEYEERMRELEEMEYPKPLREFVYGTFNQFAEKHPWLADENIRPKSIAREMIEGFHTFSGYVKRYGLQRSEGLLLRHINNVYKVLSHTVPDAVKSEPIREMETYFSDMLRQVDSSLLDEWEQLQNPDYQPLESEEPTPIGAGTPTQISADPEAFQGRIRTRIFNFLGSLSRLNFGGALESLVDGVENPDPLWEGVAIADRWSESRLQEAVQSYRETNGMFRLDPAGRAKELTLFESNELEGAWVVRHTVLDSSECEDWVFEFVVSLDLSDLSEVPAMRLVAFDSGG